MKKLINDPEDIPRESTEGFVAAHPELVRLADDTLAVLRVDGPTPGRVAVVSGGGSGHEPLHTGYVGRGMLDAAVVGAVYTSPTPDAILRTLRQVDGGAGVVVVVKNYAGDRMNAETALELAALDALEVTSVLVDDDVAVPDAAAGRRGVAGTVVVEKVAGAAADRGDGLEDVARIARRAGARTRSMGLATRGPVAPHSGEPGFRVPDDEVELGIGIHGERGRERIAFGTGRRAGRSARRRRPARARRPGRPAPGHRQRDGLDAAVRAADRLPARRRDALGTRPHRSLARSSASS